MRPPPDWTSALNESRLLILSPFERKHHRPTVETGQTGQTRNLFVASIADGVFVVHAELGSKTEQFCRNVLALGKPLLTLESAENANLVALGAIAVTPAGVAQHWRSGLADA